MTRNLLERHAAEVSSGIMRTRITINKRNQLALKRDLPDLIKAARAVASAHTPELSGSPSFAALMDALANAEER